jgi:hypothetical protein
VDGSSGSAGDGGDADAGQCGAGTSGPAGFSGDAGCELAPVDTNTDPTNCGERGHVCAPVSIATGQGMPGAMAFDDGFVYWANSGTETFRNCVGSRGGCLPYLVWNSDGAIVKMPVAAGLRSQLRRASGI